MVESHGQNKVFINPEGYLEIALVGDQSEGSFRRLYSDAVPLIEEFRTKNNDLLCLFDLTHDTGFTLGSNKVAMELLESTPYDKIAMFNVPHAEVTKGIILAIGKSDKTKIFKNREEAVAWLLSKEGN